MNYIYVIVRWLFKIKSEPRKITEVELLQAQLHGVYEGGQQWEERARSAETALFELVALKMHKDRFGKDEDYERLQPLAWQKAKAHFKTYDL